MKTTTFVASTLAAVAAAQPAFLNSAYDVQQGQPFELRYTGCSSGCTILLQDGPRSDLTTIQTLTCASSLARLKLRGRGALETKAAYKLTSCPCPAADATGSSTTVTLSNVPSGQYAFKIIDNSDQSYNYSPQFTYQGTGTATASASSASTTSSVASTTSASSMSTTSASSSSSSSKSSKTSTTSMTSVTSSSMSSTMTTTTTAATGKSHGSLAVPAFPPHPQRWLIVSSSFDNDGCQRHHDRSQRCRPHFVPHGTAGRRRRRHAHLQLRRLDRGFRLEQTGRGGKGSRDFFLDKLRISKLGVLPTEKFVHHSSGFVLPLFFPLRLSLLLFFYYCYYYFFSLCLLLKRSHQDMQMDQSANSASHTCHWLPNMKHAQTSPLVQKRV